MNQNIAVDGPAGAGKSTIAKMAAKQLNYIYVDTGAMYRAMAVYFLRKGLDASMEKEIGEVCKEVEIEIKYEKGEQQIILNQENITSFLRTEETGKMASAISIYPTVREKLVELQRTLAKKTDVIMDGRDIGTCVLKDAMLKIYLTAKAETRAKRRTLELEEKGIFCDFRQILKDIEERDYQDMHRKISPLRQAEDAVLIDSSDMSPEQVVQKILELHRERTEK